MQHFFLNFRYIYIQMVTMRRMILFFLFYGAVGFIGKSFSQSLRGENKEIQKIPIPQMKVKQYDLTSGQVRSFRSVNELGETALQLLEELTPEEYKSHPEYGLIPPTNACSNCIELIHERRPDMRVFVHVDTPSIKTYETVYGYLHYQDEEGNLRTLSDEISFHSSNWVCTGSTPFQRCLNLQTGEIKVSLLDNGYLRFGHETLLLLNDQEQIIYQEQTNTSSASFGIDGTLHPNYFSLANREAIIKPGGIKTNYVLSQSSPLLSNQNFAYLLIQDTVFLPSNHQMIYNPSENQIYIQNENGEWIYTFYPPHIYTRNPNVDRNALEEISPLSQIAYNVQSLSPNAFIYQIKIPKAVFSLLPYPIVIDPLSTFYSPYYGSRMYFRYTRLGAQCWKPLGNHCGYSVTVNVPALQGGTITSVRFEDEYDANCYLFGCCFYMNDGAFKIMGPCGISPSNNSFYWFCNASNPGTCTADGSAAYEIYTETTNCIVPACSFSLTYQMRNYDCYNACLTGGCGGNRTRFDYLYHPQNTYRIILDLRTVENNPTAEGSSGNVTVTCADLPVDLCANPSYGVPPYSTDWYANGSPIGSGNCITHNPPPNSTVTYTAVTTDACGKTYSNTVTVTNNCTLPIEFVDVKVFRGQKGPLLKWAIGGKEEGSPSYFAIEKSTEKTSWETIGKVPYVSGIQSYSFEDPNPTPNTTLYYRIKLFYTDGQYLTSKTVSYVFIPSQITI